MPDSPDQPTQRSENPPRAPRADETLDAPPDGPTNTLTFGRAGAEPDGSGAEPPGFAVVRELGSGGMGVVYEARQLNLNRAVALKVLRGRAGAQDVLRFLAEAEAVAAIKHPNVVQVYEFGQHAGGPYMALELLSGGTLAERLRRDGRFDPRAAAALVAQLADAVQAAHDLGIIHRDLKPGNVLFGAGGAPKVTDFGLAKKGGADLTRTQAVMGTPAYMAPEQARGDAKFVGPAADVWALGAILYECLTGKQPFGADDTFAVLRKVMDEAPAAPRAHAPDVPRDLERIALKCLEKTPADRYPSAAALAADLQSYLAGRPVSVRPAGPAERALKWVRRNPVVAGAGAAALLALVAGSAVSLAFGLEARERAAEAARANDDLTRTNDELTRSRDDLGRTTDELKNMIVGANRARHDLLKYAGDLKDSNETAARSAYLSDIAVAAQMWKANDLRGAREALARCPPDRRKWEWHHLDAACRPDRAEYPTDALPTDLEYSPDGQFLAWGTLSGTVVVRDLATDRERFKVTPPEPLSTQPRLAFRPSGGELAYTLNTKVYRLDLATGRSTEIVPQGKPEGERLSFQYVALGYAADGRVLAALETRGEKPEEMTITVRDPAAGKGVAVVRGPTVPSGIHVRISGAAFDRDCTRLAATFVDSGVRSGGKGPAKFEPFHPTVFVWDLASGKELVRTGGGGVAFGSVAFDREGREVAYGRVGAAEHLPAAGGAPRVFSGHAGEVMAVAFGGNGLFWSGGEDKRVIGFDRASGAERLVLRGCRHSVLRLAVSPDGKEVAAAAGDLLGGSGSVHRFDATAADVWRAGTGRDRVSLVAALAPTGDRFAACDFAIGDEGEGRARVALHGPDGPAVEVRPAGPWFRGAYLPDGTLVVLERDRELRIVTPEGKPSGPISLPKEISSHAPSVVVAGRPARFAAVAASNDPAKKGGFRGTRALVVTWGPDRPEPRQFAPADLADAVPAGVRDASLFPTGAGFDPAGNRLAASFALGWQDGNRPRLELRGVLVVWDVASGKELFRRVTDEGLNAAGFDPQGRAVAAGGTPSGGVLYAWGADGKEELVLRGHTRPVLAFAFGPDGRLATGGADRVVKLWDVSSRREVLGFDGFQREVIHLAFTADGKNLVAATGVDLLGAMMARGALPSEWPPAEVRVFRGPR